jgi:hypothetical protein
MELISGPTNSDASWDSTIESIKSVPKWIRPNSPWTRFGRPKPFRSTTPPPPTRKWWYPTSIPSSSSVPRTGPSTRYPTTKTTISPTNNLPLVNPSYPVIRSSNLSSDRCSIPFSAIRTFSTYVPISFWAYVDFWWTCT